MYDELGGRLHRYSENCVAYKLDADFASAVQEAADAIEELQTYADLYKDMIEESQRVARKVIDSYPRWIPVSERLPDEDTSCLVFLVGGEFSQLSWMSMAIFYSGVFRYDDHSGEFDQITHWMPLPEPPEKENE